MKPVEVSWHDSLYNPTLDHMYEYIQNRMQALMEYSPVENAYRYGDRREPATANRFEIYKLVAARL
jgi:hypothetical protein